MKIMFTKFTLIFTVVFSLIVTGCPQKSIDQAKRSSAKIATYANVGVDITRDLYRSKLLSLTNKDRIADQFIALAKAGQTFDAALVRIEQQYGPDAPPRAEIDRLFAVFDAEVVDRLVDILRSVGLSGIPERFREVVNTLKSAVIVVAKIFKRDAAVSARLEVA